MIYRNHHSIQGRQPTADYTSGMVSGLTAKQRYPWNGLVDISFTLSGPESGYWVAVTATNSATSEAIPVRTLRDRAGNAITRGTEFAPGTVSLVWNAGTDVPNTLIEALALSVVTVAPPPPPDGQLWAGGPYWAETNIGAENPEDYGLYFLCGDTVGYRREGNAWVASDGISGLETTVTGPGTLAWHWKLAVEGVSGLDVIVDGDSGNPARTYEASSNWAGDSLVFDDNGTHSVRFEFWNLGSSPSDCA